MLVTASEGIHRHLHVYSLEEGPLSRGGAASPGTPSSARPDSGVVLLKNNDSAKKLAESQSFAGQGDARDKAAEKVNAGEKRDGDPAVKIDYPDHRHSARPVGGRSTPSRARADCQRVRRDAGR